MTDSIDVSNNTILIPPPKKGEVINLNKLINQAPEGSIIRFSEGIYLVNATIALTKSIRLEGAGIGKTVIRGTETKPTTLLESTGESNIELEGIDFEGNNENKMLVARISGKTAKLIGCSFSGGVRKFREIKPDDLYGKGLLIERQSEFEIDQCQFGGNEYGLRITDQAKAVITNSIFTNNNTGLSVSGTADVTVVNSTFKKNEENGLVFDGFSSGTLQESLISDMDGLCYGLLLKENSTLIIQKNKFSNCEKAIYVEENSKAIIEGNKIIKNSSTGISVEGSSESSISNNEIHKNSCGIEVGYDAKVTISRNEIHENESGVEVGYRVQATITQNHIFQNERDGIVVEHHAICSIYENQINENRQTGIQISGDADVDIQKNQIHGNLRNGIGAWGESTGIITKNILIDNGISNFSKGDSSKVKFSDNQEIIKGGSSVSFREVDGALIVSPPTSGEKVSFNELVLAANPGQEIRIKNGYYHLSESIHIDKPLKIIAAKPGKVTITGVGFETLIDYGSQDRLTLSGIKFLISSDKKSNGIIIHSGDLDMDHCEVHGGKALALREFCAGVLLQGNSHAKIADCYFEKNTYGIAAIDNATIDLIKSKFSYNRYGLYFTAGSIGSVTNNEFSWNLVFGMAVLGQSTVEIIGNSCEGNSVGLAFGDNTKAKIINNKSSDNKARGIFIDGNAQCSLIKNTCCENEISGVGVFGDAQVSMEKNKSDYNNLGIEIAENARVVIKDNSTIGNGIGIVLDDSADVTIESNRIYENEIGIEILGKAVARISGNKIINNEKKSLKYKKKNKPTLGENEIVEYSEETDSDIYFEEDDESDIEREAVNPGDLFAQILGSENLSKDPTLAIIPLGHLFSGNNEVEEVENEDEDDNEGDDEAPASFDARGRFKFRNGDIQGAIDDYSKAIQINPDPVLFSTRALFYMRKDEYEKAIEDLTQALNMDPENDKYLSLRAKSNKKLEKLDEALADLDEAIRLNQNDFKLYMERGHIFLQKDEDVKAEEDFSCAIKLNPTIPQTWMYRGITFIGRDYEKAVEDFSAAINLDPDEHSIYSMRGDMYKELGNWKEALSDYEKSLELGAGRMDNEEEIKEAISEMKKKLEGG